MNEVVSRHVADELRAVAQLRHHIAEEIGRLPHHSVCLGEAVVVERLEVVGSR